jgi:hypothetical protein
MPRVVRLGRAANDNARQPAWRARIVTISLLLALSAWFVAERLFR